MKLIGLAGWSGAGKTTLLTRLIPCLAARGIGVSTLKHAHHRFDVDTPGKDSWLHREAGARQVLVSSEHRWALMTENRGAPEPDLRFLLSRLSPVDLVIVEGFKRDSHPKVEVHRERQRQALDPPGGPACRGRRQRYPARHRSPLVPPGRCRGDRRSGAAVRRGSRGLAGVRRLGAAFG